MNVSRIRAIFFLIAAFVLIYLGTNHLDWRTPQALPLFGWEKALPFLPWTIVFYLLTYFQVVWVFVLIGRRDVKPVWLGMIGIMIINGLFFLAAPTYYSRPPLPADTSVVSRWLYDFLTAIDSPQNCFPSLHIALSLFATFVFWRHSRCWGLISLLLTILTIISTLTLKQHYFIDIIGGSMVAAVVYWLLYHSYDSRRKDAGYRRAN